MYCSELDNNHGTDTIQMSYKLGDFLKDINVEKRNLLREDPGALQDYEPYLINKNLSNFLDTILLVQELNKRPNLTKQQHYDFLINVIRPKKRFARTPKPENIDGFHEVKGWFGFNDARTIEVLKRLDNEEIEEIKQKMQTGGRL